MSANPSMVNPIETEDSPITSIESSADFRSADSHGETDEPASPFERFIVRENGVDALVFCGTNPKRAVISFSSMNPGKYERWSWFYEQHTQGAEDLYIVLKDDSQHYYIGTDVVSMHVRHYKFLSAQLSKYGISLKDTYMIGSSMGGYAAIYFGFWLGAGGIIAINPQVNYSSSRRHKLQNWERMIRESGSNWVDLNDFVYRFQHKPKMHLEHGDYPADCSAANSLIASLDDLKITYTREFSGGDHGGASLTKNRLFDLIDYWSK